MLCISLSSYSCVQNTFQKCDVNLYVSQWGRRALQAMDIWCFRSLLSRKVKMLRGLKALTLLYLHPHFSSPASSQVYPPSPVPALLEQTDVFLAPQFFTSPASARHDPVGHHGVAFRVPGADQGLPSIEKPVEMRCKYIGLQDSGLARRTEAADHPSSVSWVSLPGCPTVTLSSSNLSSACLPDPIFLHSPP